MSKATKTEHNGPKNRGGYWGLRVIAKQHSKKVRRRNGKQLVRVESIEQPEIRQSGISTT